MSEKGGVSLLTLIARHPVVHTNEDGPSPTIRFYSYISFLKVVMRTQHMCVIAYALAVE